MEAARRGALVIDLDERLGLGVDHSLLPAILVGFGEKLADPLDHPAFVTFEQQYAGYLCSQQALTGVLLPLRERRDAEALVGDLEVLMCDSPKGWPICERPDLAPLHLWSRDQYLPEQRVVLDRVLEGGPPLPQVIAAAEALVELDASDPLRFFEGWQALSSEGEPLAPGLDAYQPFDAALLDGIRRLRPGSPLRVFLVWENSD